MPTTNTTAIGLNGGSTGLVISSSQLAAISNTGTLVVGSKSTTGGLTLNAPLDVSANSYNLQLLQGNGNITTTNESLTLGSHSLVVFSSADVQLGAINTSGSVSITGNNVTFNDPVSSPSSLTLIGFQSISGGPSDVISSNSMNISTQTLSLTTADSGTMSLVVSVNGLTVTNVGNLTNLNISASGNLVFNNTGNVTVTGLVDPYSVSLTLNAGSVLTIPNGDRIVSSSPTTITADQITLGSSQWIVNSSSVTIEPATATLPITLGNTGSGLLFTNADLNNMGVFSLILGSATTTGGITITSPLTLTSVVNLQLVQGAGGSVNAQGNALSLPGNLAVSVQSGSISVDAITSAGGQGTVSLQTNGSGSTITLTNITTPLPNANSISILAGTGTISGLPTTITPNRDASGNGGSIYLSASNLTSYAGLTLDVSGTGTGNGGTASYASTATTAFTPTISNLLIHAGGVNAGNVIISTGGNFTYNPSSGVIDAVGTSGGASITLSAGTQTTGNLLVTGALSVAGSGINGAGGSIALNSNSTASFIIDSATTTSNGIVGTLNVAGSGGSNGGIVVTNAGGGIVDYRQALTSASSISLTAGSSGVKPITGILAIGQAIGDSNTTSVSLTTHGTASIAAGYHVLTGNTISLNTDTGAISAITNASTLSANTGTSGNITITNQRVGTLTLNTSDANGILSVTNTNGSIASASGATISGTSVILSTVLPNSSVSLGGNVTATNATTGSVTLTATGAGTIESAGIITARTVTFNTGSSVGAAIGSGTALQTNATVLAINSTGSVNIKNTNAGTLTVTAATSANSFALSTAGALTFNPYMTNATSVSLTAGGNLTINGWLGNTYTTSAITLLTSGSGNITGAGRMSTYGTVDFNIGTGELGTSTIPLYVNAPSVTAAVGTKAALIHISDLWNASPITINSTLPSAGLMNFTTSAATTFSGSISGTSVTINVGGAATFGEGITASSGAVNVTTSAGSTFGGTISGTAVTLHLGGGSTFPATVTASSGAVTINETGTGSTVFNSGANISAATSVYVTAPGAATFNNISTSKGALTVFTHGTTSFGNVSATGSGLTPGNVSITQYGGGLLTLGSSTSSASSASGYFSAAASGSGIATNGTITAASSVILRNFGANGGVTLNGSVLATNATGAVTVTASGNGTILDAVASGADSIQATSVTLNTGTANGNGIGTGLDEALAVRVTATNLAANSTGLINIYSMGSSALTVTGANSNNQTLTLNASGNVTLKSSLANAAAIGVFDSGVSSSITVSSTVLGGANTQVILLDTNKGNIVTNSTIIKTNAAGVVALFSNGGNVAGNLANTAPAYLYTPAVQIPSAGTVNVRDLMGGTTPGSITVSPLVATGNVTFASAGSTTFWSLSGANITLTAPGSTAFNGNITATGAFALNETGSGTTTFAANTNITAGSSITMNTNGSTTFGSGSTVTAGSAAVNGSITLKETNGLLTTGINSHFTANGNTTAGITLMEETNVLGSGIAVSYGTNLQTLVSGTKSGTTFPLPGQISLVIGTSVPTAPVAGQTPANVTVDTSNATNPNVNKAYFGTVKNISATGTNTMTVTGNSAIIIYSGSAAGITLGGSTNITADPPAGSNASSPVGFAQQSDSEDCIVDSGEDAYGETIPTNGVLPVAQQAP